MGTCASGPSTTGGGKFMGNWSTTVKVIHSDHGKLQEFQRPIKAKHVLSDHPTTFLCSSDNMFINCHVPHMPGDEELQMGQIYFFMPLTRSNYPLSLQELCSLAIKGGSALKTEAL
uniref:uncharacterized protein LOC122601478 n=1 Tax=Erigeron canadensis TaxID=72917 RepID=UPI001CB93CE4|nr:uncharacterized protein LOC122601478 [Erigeron canadensis]